MSVLVHIMVFALWGLPNIAFLLYILTVTDELMTRETFLMSCIACLSNFSVIVCLMSQAYVRRVTQQQKVARIISNILKAFFACVVIYISWLIKFSGVEYNTLLQNADQYESNNNTSFENRHTELFQSFVFQAFFRLHFIPTILVNLFLMRELQGRAPRIDLYGIFANALWIYFASQYLYSAIQSRKQYLSDYRRLQKYSEKPLPEPGWQGIYGLLFSFLCCAYAFARAKKANFLVLLAIQLAFFVNIYYSVDADEFYFIMFAQIPVSFLAILIILLQIILKRGIAQQGDGSKQSWKLIETINEYEAGAATVQL